MQLPYRKPGKYTHQSLDPHITQSKFTELEKKLGQLKKRKPFLASEVSRLAENGDFSENASYQAAKRKLRGNLSAITKLEYQLRHATIISAPNSNIVHIGSTVTVASEKIETQFTILGSTESKPEKGIISHTSPIGAALLGKKIGDLITIKLPTNTITYRIKSIK